MIRQTTKIRNVIVAALVALGFVACSSEEATLLDNATRNASFTVAVAPQSDVNQPTQVYVMPQVAVDPTTVLFCAGTPATCQQATAWIKSIPGTIGGKTAFATAQTIQLGQGTQFHIYAKTSTGQQVTRSVSILRKGAIAGGIPGAATAIPQTNGGVSGGISDCYKGDAFICEVERLVAEKTNAYRAQSGKKPLAYSGHVGFVSRIWSQSQANAGNIGHSGFPSVRTSDYKKEFGSMEGISLSAENVAMSGGSGGTAEAVATRFTNMWWNSPGHKANMLGGHSGIGVGFVKKGSSYYGTQIFYRN